MSKEERKFTNYLGTLIKPWASLVAQVIKNLPAMLEI
jgi:hypothetical protein